MDPKRWAKISGNDVRISNDLSIKFQLHKIIFPFKVGKILSIIIIIIIIMGNLSL